MKFVAIVSPGSLQRLFVSFILGKTVHSLERHHDSFNGCSSSSAVFMVATNAVYPAPTMHSHLPTLVVLFNPVSFPIRFFARFADTARQFDFPHRYYLSGRYKYCQGLESSPPEFGHSQSHNDDHVQVLSARHFGLRPPVDGFCPVSGLGAMRWNGLEYVHVLYGAST